MTLPLRIQKLAIVLGVGGCITGTFVAVLWATRVPTTKTSVAPSVAGSTHPPATAATGDLVPPPRDEFAKSWDIPLRRPLYDAPPPKPEVRVPPPLAVELLGTIIEGDNSMAIIRSPQGGVEYKRTGDLVGPDGSQASIVEIRGDSIVLDRSEERIILAVRSQDQRR